MRALPLTVLLVALTSLFVGPTPIAALFIALVATPALVTRGRMTLLPSTEAVSSLLGWAIVWLIAYNLPTSPALDGGEPIHAGWAAFGTSLLGFAALRLWIQAPKGGVSLTLGLALASLAVWGAKRSGAIYAASVITTLGLALLALRAADPARPGISQLARRHRTVAGAGLITALALTSLAALSLPPLHAWVVKRAMSGLKARSGFSTLLWLGSMKGMLTSERLVLRVSGAPVTHLRGVVYMSYGQGAWTRHEEEGAVHAVPQALPPHTQLTEVEVVMASPRYFTPLDTRELAASTGFVSVTGAGVFSPVAGDPSKRLWIARGGERRFPVTPPGQAELTVPRQLFEPLRTLALRWTEGASTPSEKLTAIAERLRREYRYSLDFERQRDLDPIVDFLYRNKQGHCEYFASALALLARSIGIPTRLVAGYSVSEYNEIGGYWVVRERHAHSWVEGWTGSEWETYDPTAQAEGFGGEQVTGALPAAFDALGAAWSRLMDWLLARELYEVVLALLGAIALLVMARLIRLRRERRLRQRFEAGYSDPLPEWLALERALAERGLGRGPAETLTRWRARVTDALPEELAAPLGDVSERYIALRYAEQQDDQLSPALTDLTQRVKRALPRRSAAPPL
ncbi:MAG: transglutaminase domain-containing protein [Polyangiaceae bacterium]|nr:transglutaminase domain-containing protein [Polyangiaceae bacterium]MCW5791281.1 transglutaminase domain-containing protein [Polyangiaceae bacterium]